jgi:TetR/AcrR family transcriptional regulator, regulator of biofilm formation and stress response
MPKGTHDPERADRLAVAALEIVSTRGIEGLTHRAVAAQAGVPLGSTTYHFKTRDGLIEAALTVAKVRNELELTQVGEAIAADGDVVGHFSAFLVDTLGRLQGRTGVDFELYIAALRRPELQPLGLAWRDAMPAMLSAHVSSEEAERLSIVADGIVLMSFAQGFPVAEDETRDLLTRCLD